MQLVGKRSATARIVWPLCRLAWTQNRRTVLWILHTKLKFQHSLTSSYVIGRYNPSVRIIDLVSRTTYIVCVSIYTCVAESTILKSTPNDKFMRNFSWQFLFALKDFARNLLRGNHRRNSFCFLFWCLVFVSKPGFTSNKPTHYLQDYSGFIWCPQLSKKNLLSIDLLEFLKYPFYINFIIKRNSLNML